MNDFPMASSVLSYIVFLPIITAFCILLGAPARKSALWISGLNVFFTLLGFYAYDRGESGYQLAAIWELLPVWGLRLHLAADGLSLVMLLLTSIVTFAAVWVTPTIEKRVNLFYACILLISAGAAGAFASQDLFFFYAFHELALIPTFLMIGLWGSGVRQKAAWQITIYLAVGSIVLLIGLIKLYLAFPLELRTFDIQTLIANRHVLDAATQAGIYIWLLIGFGILISLFPFHTWAPTAYASAPTPVAMLHAGVLKKFGLYGLIRVALPLLPEGSKHWANLLLVLLVCNIIYIGLVTIAQKKLDYMLGYSSVMHMGYVFLGIAAGNVIGVTGASLLMLAHGLSIAVLFAMSGEVRRIYGTLEFSKLGGIAKKMPFLGYAFGIAAFASIGLPGFANFSSELMVFFGAFKSDAIRFSLDFTPIQIATIFGLWGVVISAVYMLRMYRQVFMGEPDAAVSTSNEPSCCIRVPVIGLILALVVGGFCPQLFINYLKPSAQALIHGNIATKTISKH